MFQYKPVLLVLSTFRATTAICCRCRFSTERFGGRMRKAYKLAGSSWVAGLACKCRCPDRLHRALVHSVVRHGKKVTTGIKALLRKSAAYPPRMGQWIVRRWLAHSPHIAKQQGEARHLHPSSFQRPRPKVPGTSSVQRSKPKAPGSGIGHQWKRPCCTGTSSSSTSSSWKNPLAEGPKEAAVPSTGTADWKQPAP